jgi:parvulin-like peptidyl-prolyl isomerase
MDDLYLYANLLQDSALFPELNKANPYDAASEMKFEEIVAKNFRDKLPGDKIDEIKRVLETRNHLVKGFYLKMKYLSGYELKESDLKSCYEEIKNKEFHIPELREFWYLFISAHTAPETMDWTKARAEKIKAETQLILENKPIESMAEQWNSPQYFANKCMKIGPAPRGKYSKQIDDIIFSLKEGETSDFIETPKGFIKIKMIRIQPGSYRPYENVAHTVRSKSIFNKDQEIMLERKKELWNKYKVSYKWEEWQDRKTGAEMVEELKSLCAKLSLDEDFATTPSRGFEDAVFDLLLVKEFDDLPKNEKGNIRKLLEYIENRHITLRALEYESDLRTREIKFTEQEMKEFYEKNPGHFYQGGIIEARIATFLKGRPHKIEALTMKDAKEVADFFYQRLTLGDDFAMLAKQLSQDKFAEKGGHIGVVDEQQSTMGAIFDINAFKLKEGEFTQPLKRAGKGDYLIIKADKVQREKKLLPYEKVKVKVDEVMRTNRGNDFLIELSNEYMEKAKKEISEDLKNKDRLLLHPIFFAWQ